MTVLSESGGWTPVIDSLARDQGLITAAVYGVVWRYCQMQDRVCRASLDTLSAHLHLDRGTVLRHIKKLCAAGYLRDLTPDRRNAPHVYADTGQAGRKQTPAAPDRRGPGPEFAGEAEILPGPAGYDDEQGLPLAEWLEALAEEGVPPGEWRAAPGEWGVAPGERAVAVDNSGVGFGHSGVVVDNSGVVFDNATVADSNLKKDLKRQRRDEGGEGDNPPSSPYGLVQSLLELCQLDPAFLTRRSKGTVQARAQALADNGYTPADLAAFSRWWSDYDWRGLRGEAPTLDAVGVAWGRFLMYRG